MTLDGKKVLILAAPLYEDMELHYPLVRLREAGATVTVAGVGDAEYKGKHGMPIKTDVHAKDARADDFDALVIPGGYAPDKLRQDPAVLDLVRGFDGARKTIGFICHAGWVPISAGILKGRRATSVKAIKDDMVNAGVDWVDEACVVDGNLVTARVPDDLPVWLPKLIESIAGGSRAQRSPAA